MWLLIIPPLGILLAGLVSYWADGIVQAHREQRARNDAESPIWDRT